MVKSGGRGERRGRGGAVGRGDGAVTGLTGGGLTAAANEADDGGTADDGGAAGLRAGAGLAGTAAEDFLSERDETTSRAGG